MSNILNKAYASADVVAGFGVSGGLISTPLWMGALTDWLQLLTLVVGILVGLSAYRLNVARRKELEED